MIGLHFFFTAIPKPTVLKKGIHVTGGYYQIWTIFSFSLSSTIYIRPSAMSLSRNLSLYRGLLREVHMQVLHCPSLPHSTYVYTLKTDMTPCTSIQKLPTTPPLHKN